METNISILNLIIPAIPIISSTTKTKSEEQAATPSANPVPAKGARRHQLLAPIVVNAFISKREFNSVIDNGYGLRLCLDPWTFAKKWRKDGNSLGDWLPTKYFKLVGYSSIGGCLNLERGLNEFTRSGAQLRLLLHGGPNYSEFLNPPSSGGLGILVGGGIVERSDNRDGVYGNVGIEMRYFWLSGLLSFGYDSTRGAYGEVRYGLEFIAFP